MDVFTHKATVDGRAGEFRIDCYADTHIGSASCDEKLLRKHIQQTKDSGSSWVFIDDAIDGITPSDRKRWNDENVASWVLSDSRNMIRRECERWADIFSPISGKCLFAIIGDTSHYQTGNISDCMDAILPGLGIKRYKGAVYAKLSIARAESHCSVTDLVFAHGFFAGRTGGSKVNNLERCLDYFPYASAFICGHGHTKCVSPPHVGLFANGSTVQSIYRRAAMTGGYLKTYSSGTTGYGEYKLYPPVALGRITLVLRPFAHEDQKRIEFENA